MKMNKIFADVLSQLDLNEFYKNYELDLSKKGNFNCPFPDHEDKNPSCSIDPKKGVFCCHSCGRKGSMIDFEAFYHNCSKQEAIRRICIRHNIKNPLDIGTSGSNKKFNPKEVEICHDELTDEMRLTLNSLGIKDEVINEAKVGRKLFKGKEWFSFPIKNQNGKYVGLKLRHGFGEGKQFCYYPSGVQTELYGYEVIEECGEELLICEGEIDALVARSKGLYAVAVPGAEIFKREWIEPIKNNPDIKRIGTCTDNDPAGKRGAEKILQMLHEELEGKKLFRIELPEEVGKGGDITNYFNDLKGNPDDLFNKYAKEYPEKIDTSRFKPLSNQELLETLGLTIKKDETNKLITFYGQLSAYTEDSQQNISNSAPSSTGKSYSPMEIAQLFPAEDVIAIGYCSSTAFFHDHGNYNKETNTITIDFSGKVIIFLDQPHSQLLQNLRPLLSHDKKEILIKITDKSQKGGHRTKNVLLRGYPAVVFCTTGLNIDEQESTRFILLSPETSQEKIRAGVCEKIKKDSDKKSYKYFLEGNPKRMELKERIKAIKQEKIQDIIISNPKKLEQLFFEKFGKGGTLKPRHQRDIGKITSLIKTRALVNLWFRERDGSTIIANEEDIEDGFNLWCEIAESQELNLPPYVYKIYQEVILQAYEEKNHKGLERNEVLKKHFKIYSRPLQEKSLRLEIIPMLENSGLIYQEEAENDKRKKLIYPTKQDTTSNSQNNSVADGGIDDSAKNNSVSSSGVEDIDSLFEPVKKKEE